MRRFIRTSSQCHRRAGTLFHYYLTYLFLTSVLLTTTGLCLHTVLKADRLDEQASRYLQTLLRMEGDLRADGRDSVDVVSTSTELTFHLPQKGDIVRWVVRDNVLTREKNSERGLVTSERFVFRKGATLGFTSENDTEVRLRVTDPPRPGYSGTTEAAIAENLFFVEILLIVRPVVPVTLSAQATTANDSSDEPAAESPGAN